MKTDFIRWKTNHNRVRSWYAWRVVCWHRDKVAPVLKKSPIWSKHGCPNWVAKSGENRLKVFSKNSWTASTPHRHCCKPSSRSIKWSHDFFFALFNFIAIVKSITCGICTKYHENTITYTNTKHSTWIFHRFCCPSYFRGEDHVAVYRTEKAFSSNTRPLSVSSYDLCRDIKMYWARRPITNDLFGKQSLAFGLGIAIGSFPQIISPKHSHKSLFLRDGASEL